ncbi:toxin-antitoxin system YwqK family antitoxin [Hymenobacter properus]|uniref:Toxin-antitoxin system YwqK family antitoxin n=1 Tax=Hymenobacter properus TaxID=2791026 RepID=A0A931BFW4_9BACT|nr:hypothetical protein [Hymenobacter properus]MBF9142729.1 hypothetical protein [Hymenobacter properus]MBR7721537.1 hypothetical protein [Microvirga sp. SRT04]
MQEITVDSVLLFYDLRYNLTPTACAAIRRHARITSQGDFRGQVRDYTIATNQLRAELYFDQGQRNGPYATFYPNGKPAMRGQFTHDEPTGTWEFWYPNGQHQQTFEWTGQLSPRLRIVAYWDSTGQPGVTNGNGRWQDLLPQARLRYGGPVLNGLPEGVWESHSLSTDKTLLTEVYEKGLFRSGKALDAPAGMARYKGASRLEPQIEDPTARGDQLHLGPTCAGSLADRERLQAMRQQVAGAASKKTTPPKPPGDITSYLHLVLDNLYQTNQRNQWENMIDGQEFIIRASVDDTGFLRLVSGQGGSGIVTALGQAVSGLPRWQPAATDGKPVASDVRFLIVKTGTRLNISLQTLAR